jgi:hypothetical protein
MTHITISQARSVTSVTRKVHQKKRNILSFLAPFALFRGHPKSGAIWFDSL